MAASDPVVFLLDVDNTLVDSDRIANDLRDQVADALGAVIVNVARGELIDEPALIAALRSGHIGAAGLDVTEPEPPLPDNPLFDLPNVILSPHCAGGGSPKGTARRQAELFAENLRRFRAGEPLRNLVDPDAA